MPHRDDQPKDDESYCAEAIQPERKPAERDAFGQPLDMPTGDHHAFCEPAPPSPQPRDVRDFNHENEGDETRGPEYRTPSSG